MIRAKGVSDTGRVRKSTRTSSSRIPSCGCLRSPTAWAATRRAKSPRSWRSRPSPAFIRRSASDTDFSWPYGIDQTLSFDGNRLRTAIHLANRRVFRAAESSDDYGGMGTTIVGVLVDGAQLAIGSVGDSRLYLLSHGALEQLTVDDSWAATILAQDPASKPSRIAQHPMRNVLTNVLGAREHVDVHLTERTLAAGDVLLLCTDGLHGVLDADDAARDPAEHATDVERRRAMLVDTRARRAAAATTSRRWSCATRPIVMIDGRPRRPSGRNADHRPLPGRRAHRHAARWASSTRRTTTARIARSRSSDAGATSRTSRKCASASTARRKSPASSRTATSSRVFDLGEDDGRPFIVMELLDGLPLAEYLRQPDASASTRRSI